MSDEKRMLTVKEAISILPDGDSIHTFRDGGMIIVGADHSRQSILSDIEKYYDTLEIAGAGARGMNHGLVLRDENGPLFIETNEDELNEIDPITK